MQSIEPIKQIETGNVSDGIFKVDTTKKHSRRNKEAIDKRTKSTEMRLERYEQWLNTPPEKIREPKEYDSDYLLGELFGETIWLKELRKYTTNNLIDNLVTLEEKEEYKKLHDEWFDTTEYGKNKKEDSKIEWEAYRKFSIALEIKYFPHEYIYNAIEQWKPKDLTKFVRGIEVFLWDTDHCHYELKEENFIIKEHRDKWGSFHWYHWELNFKLTSLKEIDKQE